MNRWGKGDRRLDGVGWAGDDSNRAVITYSSVNYPFMGAGSSDDAVRCQLEGETLVCRLTRKYHLVLGLLLTLFGPYITAVGVYKLYESWTERPESAWTNRLLLLGLVVFGMSMCALWIIQLCYNATIRFDFGEGIVEFRRTGLFPCRWRFRLQDVSGVWVERRIVLAKRLGDAVILVTEAEYASRKHHYDSNYYQQGDKINRLMLAFADGSVVKAFETGRSDVADFAAQGIAERLGLRPPARCNSTSG